jgi:16S rRNA (uracil1498-N3)-methyltransferase
VFTLNAMTTDLIKDWAKLPRLFTENDLAPDAQIILEEGQAHYFRTVLRRQEGDQFRVFNGRDGEFTAQISVLTKKSAAATAQQKIKDQPPSSGQIHLLFAPIKKQRMNFLIEKAVELGITSLHPVLTARTEMRAINEDRLRAQIIEAAEQCERMDIPVLHPLTPLAAKVRASITKNKLLWAAERSDSPLIYSIKQKDWAFLIGPEGGFDPVEVEFLSQNPRVTPISLGNTVYRAETAAFLCLAHAGGHT